MSWYADIKEANKVAIRKTQEFKEEFIVVADKIIPRCYMVLRKRISGNDPPTGSQSDQ